MLNVNINCFLTCVSFPTKKAIFIMIYSEKKSAVFPGYHLDVNLDDPRFAKVRSRLEECYAPRTYLVSYPNNLTTDS